jgi:truncated hemoglobin YjbI
MKTESLPPTHYQRIGGAEKVRALVRRFYQLMDGLPDNQRLGQAMFARL